METAASLRVVGQRSEALVPPVASEQQRRHATGLRLAAAEALAHAEEMLALLEPKSWQYGEHWEEARREHVRRMELLAQVRMELEHETDLIEMSEMQYQ